MTDNKPAESRGARLMRMMQGQREDGGGGGTAGGGGLGGDAGLSQIGAPPNSLLAMLKGRPKKSPVTECPECGEFTEGESTELCMSCGDKLRKPVENYKESHGDRFTKYRQQIAEQEELVPPRQGEMLYEDITDSLVGIITKMHPRLLPQNRDDILSLFHNQLQSLLENFSKLPR